MKKSYLLCSFLLVCFLVVHVTLSAQDQKAPQLRTQTVGKKQATGKPVPQLYTATKAPNSLTPKAQTPASQLSHLEAKLESLERKLKVLKADAQLDRSAAIYQVSQAIKDQKQQIKAFRKEHGLKAE
ncbi:MAG: hypothetical protein AAFV80_05585 [Bacteroidota bacterium]